MKYKNSDLYTVNQLFYGINFIKYIKQDKKSWISFFKDYKTLESNIKDHIISIYEWLSEEEYIQGEIDVLRAEIEIILKMNDKRAFIKLTNKYKELLERQKAIRK